MADTDSYMIRKRVLTSIVCTFLITYPNMMWIPWNLSHLESDGEPAFWASSVFRCGFFFCLFYAQLGFNIRRVGNSGFLARFGRNFLFSLAGGIVFLVISTLVPVTLGDEIRFVEAFSHVMQVRFGGKLTFNINIGTDSMDTKLPVLSLLPPILPDFLVMAFSIFHNRRFQTA